MKKVYAVKAGRETGLFTSWSECEKQVKGYQGARFKGFATAQEALAWLNDASDKPGPARRPANQKSFSISLAERSAAHPADSPADETADYIVYTDGSCLRNPDGPGGWAAVILKRETGALQELHEGHPSTTNNRMELSAAIGALSALEEGTSVALYTDSQYMKNAFTKRWLQNWKRNGWKTAKGTDVLNKDLWLELDRLFQNHQVTFRWVKGHAGNTYNERCDTLARSEAMKCQ